MVNIKKQSGKHPQRQEWTPQERAARRARQAARAYNRGFRPELQVERMKRSDKEAVARFLTTEAMLLVFPPPSEEVAS